MFRTDASIQIGTGHVMRCLTLADELTRQGDQCQFICREHEGHLGELITSKGYKLHLLPSVTSSEYPLSDIAGKAHAYTHKEWLGVPWQVDAAQTLKVLEALAVDWLVVDHYALDKCWEQQVKNTVGKLMVIDDLADRAHQANLLLDQNVLNTEQEKHYKALVNAECKLLLGPRYSLLGEEYGCLARALPERDGQVARVMIFVGGSDPHHLTERYLEAISAAEFDVLAVDVVIGKNHPAPETVAKMVSLRQGTRLYSGLPSLAALMVRADLMLGAGGTTNWERMCLGLNSIVVSVAANQDAINEELAAQELIRFVGQAQDVDMERIRSTLGRVLENRQYNRDQSRAMREVTDGSGTAQVARILAEQVLAGQMSADRELIE